VIQPLLPERLPCYDLVLIANLTLLQRSVGVRVLPTLLT